MSGPVEVRAVARGFYGGTMREPGEVFPVRSEADLGRWMVRTEPAPQPDGEPRVPGRRVPIQRPGRDTAA